MSKLEGASLRTTSLRTAVVAKLAFGGYSDKLCLYYENYGYDIIREIFSLGSIAFAYKLVQRDLIPKNVCFLVNNGYILSRSSDSFWTPLEMLQYKGGGPNAKTTFIKAKNVVAFYDYNDVKTFIKMMEFADATTMKVLKVPYSRVSLL